MLNDDENKVASVIGHILGGAFALGVAIIVWAVIGLAVVAAILQLFHA